MATIRQRSNKYHVQVRRQGFKTLTRSFSTRAAAQRWATATEAALDAGHVADFSLARKTTVAALLHRYEIEVLPAKRSQQAVRSHIKSLIRELGRYSLASLTTSIVATYRDNRLCDVGPQTVKHELGILRRAVNIAISEWGYTLPHGNPLMHVKAPTLPQGRTRRLPHKKWKIYKKHFN